MSARRRLAALSVVVIATAGVAFTVTRPETVSGPEEKDARAAAVRLVEADTAVGRLPDDLSQRREQVKSKAHARHQALERVWDADHVEAQAKDWGDALGQVADDAGYQAYSEERLTVTHWEGTRRHGSATTVGFVGSMEYRTSDGSWSGSSTDRYRVKLRRTPDGWRLISVNLEQLEG